MRSADRLDNLLDEGVIETVFRPLMSGKEADVFLVSFDGLPAVAKVYKEAQQRSFKHRAAYTEGRKVRNTRQQRAMDKRSSYGKEEEEEAWRNAEVDAIYRLRAADVRVPTPYEFVDGVLIMELITGPDGEPAPRLFDVAFSPNEAEDLFHVLLREVVKMLCAGVVHGDLSDFNILLGAHGPVIIDFPQATDPAHNTNARKLLLRDVRNLTQFLSRHAPALKGKAFGEEMWSLYERNQLTPETRLTGRAPNANRRVDTHAVLEEIAAAVREENARRAALGLPPPRPARAPRFVEPQPPTRSAASPKVKKTPVDDLDDLDALLAIED